jgi:hypothetical protein
MIGNILVLISGNEIHPVSTEMLHCKHANPVLFITLQYVIKITGLQLMANVPARA